MTEHQISAAEAFRRHGAEGGGDLPSGAAAHPMQRTSAHPSQAAPAGRVPAGLSLGSSSFLPAATSAANSAAGASASAAIFPRERRDEFWRRVVNGTLRLTADEDRQIWRMRAADASFAEIASRIMRGRRWASFPVASRSAAISAGVAHHHAKRWREQYRREIAR